MVIFSLIYQYYLADLDIDICIAIDVYKLFIRALLSRLLVNQVTIYQMDSNICYVTLVERVPARAQALHQARMVF
jgi:hypothetical protein